MALSPRHLAIWASASLGLPRLCLPSHACAATVLLRHGSSDARESRAAARDRYRRECEHLRSRFHPLGASECLARIRAGTLPQGALVMTMDDGLPDVAEVLPVLREFDIPLTVFVVAGWSSSDVSDDVLLARIVNFMHWYVGPPVTLDLASGLRLELPGVGGNGKAVDHLLAQRDHLDVAALRAIWARAAPLERRGLRICSWDELGALRGPGVEFGSHSVSHCRMASCSPARLEFELVESRRLVRERLGSCEVFAYPFGRRGDESPATRDAVARAGYAGAFLTESGLATAATSPFALPRLALPDEPIGPALFRSFVSGGKVPLEHGKRLVRSMLGRSGGRTEPV